MSTEKYLFGSSDYSTVHLMQEQLCRLKPVSVVDFGPGQGKYGQIVRRVLGAHCELLIGVEGDQHAADALAAKGIYDEVYPQLLQNWLSWHAPNHYSAVIFGDVIEHLKPGEIRKAMSDCMRMFDHIIIVVPLYDIFQDGVATNPLEKHQTYVTEGFFDRYLPIEKHIVESDGYTIMHLLIDTKRQRKSLKTRFMRSAFHMTMLTLQPMGLARPLVDVLKKLFGRHKALIGR